MSKSKKDQLLLKKQIKAAESRKREQSMESAPAVKVVKGDDGKPKVSFDQWWMMVSKSPKLKVWMKEIIMADFKSRGLSKEEPKESYDEALKLFGIQL